VTCHGTAETQQPMSVGESFQYCLSFPDPGVYWYHPHIREEYGQEMGLYGNIIVVPSTISARRIRCELDRQNKWGVVPVKRRQSQEMPKCLFW
jgi:FtsP/CotA-like multicopper oxidase with cupredoxin domain